MRIFAFTALFTCVNTFAACPEWLDTSMRKLHSQEIINFCEEYWGKPIKERWRENPLLMVSPNAQRINLVYRTINISYLTFINK